MGHAAIIPPQFPDVALGSLQLIAAYGPVTDEQLLRARVLALYGRHEGLRVLEREALAGLERTATAGG